MDTLIIPLLNTFLGKNTCYLQIFLEECGQCIETETSYFVLLIRSLDSGVTFLEIQNLFQQLQLNRANKFTLISFLEADNLILQCKDSEFYFETPNKPLRYGTSLSFEFFAPSTVPIELNKLLTLQPLSPSVLEFTAISKFRDLSEFNLNSAIGPPVDYKQFIAETLAQIVEASENLSLSVQELYSLDGNSLQKSLEAILMNL